MATKTVTYHVCDGANGRACNKELRGPGDGIIVHGQVYAASAQVEGSKPLVGPVSGVRCESAANETALCWTCWHAIVTDGVLAETKRALTAAESAAYDDRAGLHGR